MWILPDRPHIWFSTNKNSETLTIAPLCETYFKTKCSKQNYVHECTKSVQTVTVSNTMSRSYSVSGELYLCNKLALKIFFDQTVRNLYRFVALDIKPASSHEFYLSKSYLMRSLL